VPAGAVSASFEVQVSSATVDGAGVRLRGFDVWRTAPVLTFGSAVDTDVLVWNDGNTDAWPVFTVHADAPGGFLLGLGDRVIEYTRPTWRDSPVRVDMTGEVLVSGFDQSQYLAAREWSSIAPGTFERPRFELLQGGTGWCEVSHRDTYI
jgi:hypothetical protein